MKKKIGFLCMMVMIIIICSKFVSGQNIVPNPGFEIQDTCPLVSQITPAPPWNSPTHATPDLFNSSCSSQNVQARTGIGSSGVYTYTQLSPNYREYIQAPLTTTLTAGQTVNVSFYVKRANLRYASNRIGAYFSSGAINSTQITVLNVSPQIENNQSNMLSSSGWIQVSGSFIASGGEDHILIGSFSDDASTDTMVVNATYANKVAFYQIDDINVTQVFLPPTYTWLPVNGSMNFPVENNITITFSTGVRLINNDPVTDPASLITFKMSNSTGEDVPFTASISADNKTITIDPVSNLASLTTYYCAIGATLEDIHDLAISPGHIYFSTEYNAGIEDVPISMNKINLFPNPVKDKTKLSFNMKMSGFAEYAIIDLCGRIVSKVTLGTISAGYQSFDISTTDFRSGSYYLRLSANGFTSQVKLYIIK